MWRWKRIGRVLNIANTLTEMKPKGRKDQCQLDNFYPLYVPDPVQDQRWDPQTMKMILRTSFMMNYKTIVLMMILAILWQNRIYMIDNLPLNESMLYYIYKSKVYKNNGHQINYFTLKQFSNPRENLFNGQATFRFIQPY